VDDLGRPCEPSLGEIPSLSEPACGSKMTLAWAATGRGELDMTRTTNARIAGFTYLFYAVIGACLELLMHQARGVGDDAAKLVRIGQYVTNVRLAVLITLLECFSALV